VGAHHPTTLRTDPLLRGTPLLRETVHRDLLLDQLLPQARKLLVDRVFNLG
jgi:hypothetical protein